VYTIDIMEPRTMHYTRRRIAVSVTIPLELLELVDDHWQGEGTSRSAFVEGALREALRRGEESRQASTEVSV
jgi:metal-responsive CopG/Arc/MetJ family transcriptional regulator